MLSLPGAQVQPLARQLRSHKVSCAKNQTNKNLIIVGGMFMLALSSGYNVMNILVDGLFDIHTHVYFSNRKGGISVELLTLKKAER